jgi:hypothetical protein
MMIKTLLILLVLGVLSACETQPQQQRSLREWIGHHADEVVRVWGAPLASYQFQNGGRVLQYSESRLQGYGGGYGFGSSYCGYGRHCFDTGFYDPLTITEFRCTTRFIVNPALIVSAVEQEGNNCRWMRNKLPPEVQIIPGNASTGEKRYCREFTSTVIIDGKPQRAFARRCRQPDGRWVLVR